VHPYLPVPALEEDVEGRQLAPVQPWEEGGHVQWCAYAAAGGQRGLRLSKG